ncbi:MAG: molybdopterin guanine dinucleotide synthesis [Silicimonas sp.]|nr:molybdopterin guanine dinucleotide synthesis [Silicimonas sp.]
MVDWSGGNDTGPRPRKDAIWAGEARGSTEQEPVYLRNRVVAFDWLIDVIQDALNHDERLFIGFDFPFGYPVGFAKSVTGRDDPFAIWRLIADALVDTPKGNSRFDLAGELNARFPGTGPFWFNAIRREIPHLPRKGRARRAHGMKERRLCEERAKGAFTCWQMGGAGAVGGQIMTGIAVLEQLRRRFPGKIGVWPFDLADQQIGFVEIWPSLISDRVAKENDTIKDRAQVRLLARALARLPSKALQDMLDVDAPIEGWILGLGHEDVLKEVIC